MSPTHLVLIPSYNSGDRLISTVREALEIWQPVWVVVDGSTDRSELPVIELARDRAELRVIRREQNGGKGAAVLTGAEAALREGFTHVLVMDSDGQHPADHIPKFMSASQQMPAAMVLGIPVFGPEAPQVRLQGRKLSIGLARFEIWGDGIADPLFGFRVYPAEPLRCALKETRNARGFDFDPEVAVRLFWRGVPTIQIPAPCRYFSRAQGGVSHFNYLRDNVKMVWLHLRLIAQLLLWQWPAVFRAQRARRTQTNF